MAKGKKEGKPFDLRRHKQPRADELRSLAMMILFWPIVISVFYLMHAMYVQKWNRDSRPTEAVVIRVWHDSGFFLSPSDDWRYRATTPLGECGGYCSHGTNAHHVSVGTKFKTVYFEGECEGL